MAKNISIKFDDTTIKTPLNIKKKIKLNSLSDEIREEITLGMTKTKVLESFLNKHPKQNFALKLQYVLIGKYIELSETSLESDDIYYELVSFVIMQSNSFKRRPTGIATVAYFFEKCDIFES